MTAAEAAGIDPEATIATLLEAFPVSAAPFIVTLYGDVVAPRGGELWTGSIVETLGGLGIAETRVRTALSRLVAAGRLAGEKAGRRSYYRLTATAVEEFASAARLIYAPVEPPPLAGWHLLVLPDRGRDLAAATLARLRFGFPTPQLAVLPDRGALLPPLPGCRFRAVTEDDLGEAFAGAWPLAGLGERMRVFVDRFEGLETADLEPAAALAIRLMLVHAFRELALRDPLLPAALLPGDWPGATARAVFVRLYLALTPAAEAFTARLVSRSGPIRPDGTRLSRRIASMLGAGQSDPAVAADLPHGAR